MRPDPLRPAGRRPTRVRRLLDSAPFALPPVLDAVSERWWRTTPRVRTALAVLVVVAVSTTAVSLQPTGGERRVLVATEDLVTGRRMSRTDVDAQWWPSELVPDGALDSAPDGVAGVVAATVPRGAIVTDRHVGRGIGSSLPRGRVAVAVAAEQLPPLGAGTRLDLVAAGYDGSGTRLASDAVVIGVDAEVVWLAVAPTAAVDVTAAAAVGHLAVVVHPS